MESGWTFIPAAKTLRGRYPKLKPYGFKTVGRRFRLSLPTSLRQMDSSGIFGA
jgi:hypothetical protein